MEEVWRSTEGCQTVGCWNSRADCGQSLQRSVSQDTAPQGGNLGWACSRLGIHGSISDAMEALPFPARKTTVPAGWRCLEQAGGWQGGGDCTLLVSFCQPDACACSCLRARTSPPTISAGSDSSLSKPVISLFAPFPACHTGASLRLSGQGNGPAGFC